MAAELVCPKHGPYDASLKVCPICSGGTVRPAQPRPLEEDDMPTDAGLPPQGATPHYQSGRSANEDDMETELPNYKKKAGRGFLDSDDIDETELPHRGRDDETELDFETSTAMAILWVKEGHRRGQIFKISKDRMEIGREADLVLDDEKASKHHAAVVIEDGQFVIWDLASRNGTYVNNEKIRAATPLKENDIVKIGSTIFVVKVLD